MIDELHKFLSKFIEVSPDELAEFERLDVIKSFKKDTLLLREGEISIKTFFILKGCIRVYYVINGDEKTTAFYIERNVVTPQTVIDGKPSDYNVVCVEDCVLVVATTDMEQDFFEKYPKYESVCRVMAEQVLADKQLSFDKYMISSPEERYLHLIETNKELIDRVPQYQLASYIGIKPESLSRIRKRLQKNK